MKQNEKGSVTMVVVATVFFIVIILSSFFIYTTSRRHAQIEETQRIANSYDGDMDDIYKNVVEVDKLVAEEFNTSYGRIDIIWIDANNNVISEPNSPTDYLGEMTPVYWTGTPGNYVEHQSNDVTNNENNTWYQYASISGTGDNTTSRWANAIDSNGSYFVWVPRFAYRITYYKSEDNNTVTGYYDGRGLVNSIGEPVTEINGEQIDGNLEEGIETVKYKGNSYIVHPAFIDDTSNEFNNGGWDSDLAGIWVGKYETSEENSTLKIVPNKPSYTSLTISNMYNYSYEYNRNQESHLMKNSEWGAVVYLAHSQFGRNGHELYINNSTNFITGNSGGSTSANSASGTTYEYNSSEGVLASSTGNVYGVYDLSGGAYEYVAVWNTDSNSQYIRDNGNSFAVTGNKSTKYATAYYNKTTTSNGTAMYLVGKTGDATKEVYTGSNAFNWHTDYAYILNTSYPFMDRGGFYGYGAGSGKFYINYNTGRANENTSFRVVLAIK